MSCNTWTAFNTVPHVVMFCWWNVWNGQQVWAGLECQKRYNIHDFQYSSWHSATGTNATESFKIWSYISHIYAHQPQNEFKEETMYLWQMSPEHYCKQKCVLVTTQVWTLLSAIEMYLKNGVISNSNGLHKDVCYVRERDLKAIAVHISKTSTCSH